MTPLATQQLTLSFEPNVVERWPSLREFIAHRVEVQPKPAKTIAAELDLSPSALSRKLHPREEDSARFNVDDLERYLEKTGDTAAIVQYLAAKYMTGGDEARAERAVATVEALIPELTRALATLKGKK